MNQQIKTAEYNNQALTQLPIKGKIKKRYLASENKLITPEMIEKMVDENVSNEDKNKIVISTLSVPVSVTLGSQTCIDMLNHLVEGNNSNVQYP